MTDVQFSLVYLTALVLEAIGIGVLLMVIASVNLRRLEKESR